MAKQNNPFQMDYRLAVVENKQDAVFVIDGDGLLNYCNTQFQELVYPQDYVPIGREYRDLFNRIAAISANPVQTLVQLEAAYARRQQKSTLSLSLVKPTRRDWQLALSPLLIENHFMGWGGIIQIHSSINTVSSALPKPVQDLRLPPKRPPIEAADGLTFVTGDLSVDFARRRVRVKGQSIRLTPKEAQLLQLLAMNAGRVLKFRYLLITVWGPAYADQVRILWTNISRLRKKLGDTSGKPRYILTDGDGYYIPLDEFSPD